MEVASGPFFMLGQAKPQEPKRDQQALAGEFTPRRGSRKCPGFTFSGEVSCYQLNKFGLTFTHSLGSETQLLERSWATWELPRERGVRQVWEYSNPWLNASVMISMNLLLAGMPSGDSLVLLGDLPIWAMMELSRDDLEEWPT